MEFKGTKGKWTNMSGDNSSIDIVLDNGSTISIDRYNRYGSDLVGDQSEMEANALLISKAPEMLEMLNEVLTSEYVKGRVLKALIKKLIKEATELP
ncbi:hypothetical protein [Chryseobacterium sp.]|uniref:hypothetical protein n=1 Tax=Chryseobacterium sp. TaxID=1871047 RepID=UPI003219EDE5